MKRSGLAILAALLCAFAPFAIGQASAQQAGASPPSGQLDRFIGDGICTGHQLAEGKPPGPAKPARYHGEMTLDGHWAVMHYDENRTATNSRPFHATQYIGYDVAMKRLVTVLFTNFSGVYTTGVSTGWKGDTLTFDEPAPASGKPATERDVFTVGEAGMASHIGMLRDKHGKWVKTDQETCHKA